MQRLTPDWSQVCKTVQDKLVEVTYTMDDALDAGANPMFVACDALEELKLFIEALESDPSEVV